MTLTFLSINIFRGINFHLQLEIVSAMARARHIPSFFGVQRAI